MSRNITFHPKVKNEAEFLNITKAKDDSKIAENDEPSLKQKKSSPKKKKSENKIEAKNQTKIPKEVHFVETEPEVFFISDYPSIEPDDETKKESFKTKAKTNFK
jgi:hypothetical protein